jgi:tetratricopeptide (TPR) repeat protein
LATLIDTLMAPVPEQRPPTCEAIMQTLDRVERQLIWQRWLPLGKFFQRWRSAKNQRFRPTAVVLVSLLLVGIFRTQISISLNDQGVAAHETGNFITAQWFYRAALLMNSKNASANFNLGDSFETQQQFEQAKAAYYFALANDAKMWKAYNNLARLEILDYQPEKAISLLKKVNLNLIDDSVDRYAVLKNLGWAQLELKQYQAAQKNLESAITLDPKPAAAHCLMVPVYKAKTNIPAALAELDHCLQSVGSQNPDDHRLSILARNALPSSQIKP